ncbi:MAG: hypothetical protein IKC41_07445 [Clostridia bacterium]|nr:hypothetical protein [Clostridia bacterium]MBR2877709.1 hypothetical protein [Clostridia bacterium]MBR2974025.1 hypothetical protein [Clostridia bacterium]MBR3576902.1 hypothetical protein [Clostridia bacterium]
MWTVVYISQNEDVAKEIKQLLEDSQILVMMRSVGEDEEQKSFEILVPETEVEQAHNIIINNN